MSLRNRKLAVCAAHGIVKDRISTESSRSVAAEKSDGNRGGSVPVELNQILSPPAAQITQTGLGGALLPMLPVYGDKAEGHGISLLPLEVVHKAPVHISLYRQAIHNTSLNAGQRLFDIRYSHSVALL